MSVMNLKIEPQNLKQKIEVINHNTEFIVTTIKTMSLMKRNIQKLNKTTCISIHNKYK